MTLRTSRCWSYSSMRLATIDSEYTVCDASDFENAIHALGEADVCQEDVGPAVRVQRRAGVLEVPLVARRAPQPPQPQRLTDLAHLQPDRIVGVPRSEEHTSELQSQSNLVCRL